MSKTFGEPVHVVMGIPSPDKPESKEKLITKARKYENTKKRESKFRKGGEVKPRPEMWVKCGQASQGTTLRHPAMAVRRPNRKMAFFLKWSL